MSDFASKLRALDAEATPGRFIYDTVGCDIWSGRDDPHGILPGCPMHVADLRGWGYLTGGNRMSDERATKIQDATGTLLVTLYNSRKQLAALVEAVGAYLAVCAEVKDILSRPINEVTLDVLGEMSKPAFDKMQAACAALESPRD